MRLRFPVAFLAVFLALCGGVQGQGQKARTLSYRFDRLPEHLTLPRGVVLELRGTLDPLAGTQNLSLRVGTATRASGVFTREWVLRWDTGQEADTSCTLSLWQNNPSRAPQRYRSLVVDLVEKPPIRIVSPAPQAQITGPTLIRTEGTAVGEAARVQFTLNDNPLTVQRDEAGNALWEPGQLPLGEYRIGGTARLGDGSLFFLEPVRVQFVGQLSLVPFPFGDRLNLAASNGHIALRARIAPDIHPIRVTFLLDGRPVAQRTEPPFDAAAWNPNNTPGGAHRLGVEVEDRAGNRLSAPDYAFTLVRRSGRALSTEEIRAPLPVVENPASAASLSYTCDTLPTRLTAVQGARLILTGHYVPPTADPDKKAALLLFVDSLVLDRFTQTGGFQLKLDTRVLEPGTHSVKVKQAFSDGTVRDLVRCDLRVRIDTPCSLQVPAGPQALLRPVTLAVQAQDNFPLQSVIYYKDGEPLTPCTDAPQTAYWDPRAEAPRRLYP